MKELSIEEKAKRYDEAIEKGKQIQNTPYTAHWDIMKEVVEHLLPELAKSEDEKIRKGIIQTLKFACAHKLVGVDDVLKMKAYLEKQGEHAKFRNKIQIGDKVTRNEDGVLVNLSQLNRVAKKDEKQGEQKSSDIEEPNFFDDFRNSDVEVDSNENGLIAETLRYKKEKQGEQQPADKVEPKFKVGDWVVIDGEVLHVKEVTEDGYSTEEGGYIPFRCEKEAMLWTIQDAKDGDVLTTDTWTFIFNKYQDKFVCYHCAASAFNYFSISVTGAFDSNYVHPATKEQRDLLFQKMKETGYTWDAEKKKLEKVEFNHDDLIEESYQQQADDLIDMVTEKSAEWSEEDEKILSNIIKDLVHPWNEYIPDRIEDEIKWLKNKLKSLRPQSTWKPSDEQMKALKSSTYCQDEQMSKVLFGLYQDLKKIKG